MKKTAFISEPRKHKALKFVLENFLSILPEEWYVQINHGTHNFDYIKSIIDKSEIISNANSKNRLHFYNLGVENMTHRDESNLLRTEKFWNNIDGDLLLKFECDTILCPNSEQKISYFEKFDYIGGYWGGTLYPLDEPYPNLQPNGAFCKPYNGRMPLVMNGALSLRKKDVMIEIIKKYFDEYFLSEKTYSEDYFFSEYIDNPTTRDVINFSIDNGYIAPLDMKAPFGIHKPWGTNPSKGHGVAYEKIKIVCPEVEILKSLQGIETEKTWWEK
tara:strand:- start:530 stop:1348 length:819 start_codon:yes stop_codon:yes gene_type:complete